MMMGLRLHQGIDRKRYERLAGKPLSSETLNHLAEIGMISFDDSNVRTTMAGRAVLNAVLAELLVD